MTKVTLAAVGSLQDTTTAANTINANTSAIVTAFDNTLSRDGTSPNTMNSNLDMNSFRILNLPSPLSGSEPVRLQDVTAGGNVTINQITNTTLGVNVPQGRLTLTSSTPITTSNVAGATTLYFTPLNTGSTLPITTDGINFGMISFVELSQLTTDVTKSPTAVAASSIYDVFAWQDGSTVRATRGPAWTSDTTRGTGAGTSEIDFTTKFPTNKNSITNGPAANRGVLLGSVRSDGSSQLQDTQTNRWLSNIYNAVPRIMVRGEPTQSWVYSSATWRQANANTANQLDFIQSLTGSPVIFRLITMFQNTATGIFMPGGIALDNLTTPSGLFSANQVGVANTIYNDIAFYSGFSGIGRHYAAWLEYCSGGTGTFYGTGGTGLFGCGIAGEVFN